MGKGRPRKYATVEEARKVNAEQVKLRNRERREELNAYKRQYYQEHQEELKQRARDRYLEKTIPIHIFVVI